jgi:hypothetical protein
MFNAGWRNINGSWANPKEVKEMEGMEGYDDSEEGMLKRQLAYANQIIADRENSLKNANNMISRQMQKIDSLTQETFTLKKEIATLKRELR